MTAVDSEPQEPQITAEREDQLQLLDSGRVRFWIDGVAYLLRTPRVGEYKQLRQIVNDGNELARHAADDPAAPAYDMTETLISYMNKTGELLGDRPFPPDPDTWPLWMVTFETSNMLFNHWRSAPLGHGPTEVPPT